MNLVRAKLRVVAAAVGLLLPAVALACPACAGRDDTHPNRTAMLLGSMMLLPFGVAGVVVRVVKRIESDDAPSTDSRSPSAP